MKTLHFHFNMVTQKPMTACGILGVEGETNKANVTCKDCKEWLTNDKAPHPVIRKSK